MTATFNILDAGGFSTLAEMGALDLLTAGGRKVVITGEVIQKIRDKPSLRPIFDTWRAANPNAYFEIPESFSNLSEADKQRFNPRGLSSTNFELR